MREKSYKHRKIEGLFSVHGEGSVCAVILIFSDLESEIRYDQKAK